MSGGKYAYSLPAQMVRQAHHERARTSAGVSHGVSHTKRQEWRIYACRTPIAPLKAGRMRPDRPNSYADIWAGLSYPKRQMNALGVDSLTLFT